jgi:hypothetical protein
MACTTKYERLAYYTSQFIKAETKLRNQPTNRGRLVKRDKCFKALKQKYALQLLPDLFL